jgi:AAA domain (dynein-related subfamily)
MKPSHLVEALVTTIPQNIPIFLWGACGIGKSQIVSQAAQLLKMDYCIDVRAVQLDPTDLRGLPRIKNDKTQWVIPSFLPTSGRGILFLDELNAAAQMTQSACYQLVLDRALGDYRLPDGCCVIAAGNPASERCATVSVPRALRNRFLHLTLEPDLGEWCVWASRAGIRPEIIAFLRFRTDLLLDSTVRPDANAWPTPRSWEMASKAIDAIYSRKVPTDVQDSLLMHLLKGAVGDGVAAEFIGFLRLFHSLPSIDEILLNPAGAPLPTEPSAQIAIATALGRRITDNSIAKAKVYLDRLPDELQVLSMRDALLRDRTIATTAEFTRFAVTHGDLLA